MYHALYRKYRPTNFDSVVGQDSIVRTLRNSIIYQSFSHAYMFFGPRGTGKTTVSKIFARNINCLSPLDGNSCGKCVNCNVSFSKECVDIIEIDAASNNGVDEIRELKNRISLVPSELKYKVYIIDEVHMLSIGAFNALLKTLEEPPEHAIFILATTDPQKVPETIISRCQCFSFNKISSSVIYNRLKYVCDEEKIEIDNEVIKNVSLFADGGLRDALGMLDKLVSYSNKKITLDDFISINGIVSDSQLSKFLDSIFSGDISSVLIDIENFDVSGKNLIQIIIQLLNYSRNVLVDFYLSKNSISYDINLLQIFINLLNEKFNDIRKSSNARIFLEIFLLKFIHDYVQVNNLKNVDISANKPLVDNFNTNKIKTSLSDGGSDDKEFDFSEEFSSNDEDYSNDLSYYQDINKKDIDNESIDDNEDVQILNLDDIIRVRVNNTLALANKDLLKNELRNFELLKDYTFDQSIGYLVCALLDGNIRAVSPDNIIISYEFDSNVKQNLNYLSKMIEVYNHITNSNKRIAIISDDVWESEKKQYISNLKNNIKYEVIDEPNILLAESNKNDIISNSAVELFGDIVEVE